MTPPAPRAVSINGKDTFATCETCVILDENFVALQGSGSPSFFAKSGTLMITRSDFGTSGGMDVSGTNINLVEWDFTNDQAIAGGRCYDVGTFSISGNFVHGDGGTADM
jgi:hypothetical protein